MDNDLRDAMAKFVKDASDNRTAGYEADVLAKMAADGASYTVLRTMMAQDDWTYLAQDHLTGVLVNNEYTITDGVLHKLGKPLPKNGPSLLQSINASFQESSSIIRDDIGGISSEYTNWDSDKPKSKTLRERGTEWGTLLGAVLPETADKALLTYFGYEVGGAVSYITAAALTGSMAIAAPAAVIGGTVAAGVIAYHTIPQVEKGMRNATALVRAAAAETYKLAKTEGNALVSAARKLDSTAALNKAKQGRDKLLASARSGGKAAVETANNMGQSLLDSWGDAKNYFDKEIADNKGFVVNALKTGSMAGEFFSAGGDTIAKAKANTVSALSSAVKATDKMASTWSKGISAFANAFSNNAEVAARKGMVWVEGFSKADGTSVEGYWRKASDIVFGNKVGGTAAIKEGLSKT